MIKYENIQLVPLDKEHLSPVVAWANNLPLNRIRLYDQKITMENFQDSIDKNDLFFAAIEKSIVGFLKIFNVDWINRKTEIYSFADSVATVPSDTEHKILMAGLGFAFKEMGLNRVHANVLFNNIYLTKTYERAGFRLETNKRAHYFDAGSYHNVAELSVLSKDFDNED